MIASLHPPVGVVGHGLIPRGKLSRTKHTQRGKGRGSGHQPSWLDFYVPNPGWDEDRGPAWGATTPVTKQAGL